ncbi:MAG: 4-hydroxythreonine-4-phosphate dehydrogenase PdxA [Alphaproteobacteria bacterium]|nr:4-hydroxythreonine-4-phosphate dehydrogenase PdxA [Alphaproteobacteria bacterium]
MTPLGLPLALTMGEPAGIGGEITLMAWNAERSRGQTFFAIDDPDRLAALARRLHIDVPIKAIAEPGEAASIFSAALPVLPQPLAVPVRPGDPDPANAKAVLGSIARAVAAALQGQAAGVVTNPINKKVLAEAGFPHPGHTEYLGELTGVAHPVMMLACPGLRVVPVTIHAPLRTAIGQLTAAAIVMAGRVTARALVEDFAIAAPRIAVAGLNPHAGEDGLLGSEEKDIIAPAVDRLRAEGLVVVGPLPADSLFHARARAEYDAVLCMYHDQALIPLKTIDFDHGVDVTLGLPIVRTSPDHGTAFEIAGRGIARVDSLLAALRLARNMAGNRAAGVGPVRGRPALAGD